MVRKTLKKRPAPRRLSRKKLADQKRAETLIVLVIAYLAVIFLPWNNGIDFGLLTPTADASVGLTSAVAAVPTLAVSGVGIPVRLKIPSIKLNAAIEAVGLKKDGSMDTPRFPKDAAWYRLGPRPGETGSAVIAGHLSWWNGAFSAFANLSKVKPGDTITVQDAAGDNTNFIVSKVQKLTSSADATEVFISNDGRAHLNLVTCIGIWNKKTKQYSHRLVVFAEQAK